MNHLRCHASPKFCNLPSALQGFVGFIFNRTTLIRGKIHIKVKFISGNFMIAVEGEFFFLLFVHFCAVLFI